jgi:dipeptidyl aminopeptidase/acylaminoacyl peptidase
MSHASPYSGFLPSVRLRTPLAVSPDGNHVAYIDDALGQFNAVVQPIAGGKPRPVTAYTNSTVVSSLAWYPDGSSLLTLVDARGDELTQLHRVDMDGRTQALTGSPDVQFEDGFGYPFSPDGQRLVYSANDRSPGDQDVLVRHLVTGEVHRLYADGGRVFPGYWSPDNNWLTAIELRTGKTDHVIYVVSAEGGSVKRLTPEGMSAACWLGPWLPDGSGFLVRSDVGRDFTELGVMDAATGELTWIDQPGWDVEDLALSRDGRTLVWSVNVDGASQLRARDLHTESDLIVPALPTGEVSGLTLTPDGRSCVMLLSTPTCPANVAVLHLATGELRWLTDSRPVSANSAAFVEPTLVRFPTRSGKEVPSYVYRPESTEPVGVVVAIHGGPALQERASYSNDGFFQYLVSHGVAVFAPNIRGSMGYGMTYQKRIHRDWGGGDLEELADAIRYLKQQSWVDEERVGLVGRSYGGFVVLSCVARLPEVNWAAAVVWCGPSNLVTFTRSQPASWRSHVATMVGDPEADREFLMSRSPVTYVDQIGTPLLVIQGANDPRVPKHESDQIVDLLRTRGVEVNYDVYPDEGHWFGKRDNQIKARSGAGEFLLAHLSPRTPS